jgi:8-oxo-dGTP pyrophosphatase MutT (NUDIX family)
MELEKKKFSVGLILNPQNEILLQRKDGGAWFWPNYWCTFGGGIKNGEDPLETFSREMKQEIGLEFSEIRFFDSHEFEEIAKAGPKKGELKRIVEVNYFEARFDGDLKKIRFGEGAGFSVFDEAELVKYNETSFIKV